MSKYKIIYIGNFRPSHSTENHIAATLESMGHTVARFQEDETTYDSLLAQRGFDFYLYSRTWDGVIEKNVTKLDFLLKKTIPLVAVHLDIWWGLEREQEIYHQLMFKSDIIFSADGGHQDKWKAAGIEHYYLPPAVYDKECYIAHPKPEFKHDIIFVGSWRWYHIEHPFRNELIKWLQDNYGSQVVFYPNETYPCVRGHQLNELYASSKIVIGDSFDSPIYYSDRVFETTGRGGFLLHPANVSIPLLSTIHFDTYERWNWEDLRQKIDYYLTHDKEREKIRKAGQLFVSKNHTYKNRMEEMLNVLEERGYIGNN